jgi:hypothetical protein
VTVVGLLPAAVPHKLEKCCNEFQRRGATLKLVN